MQGQAPLMKTCTAFSWRRKRSGRTTSSWAHVILSRARSPCNFRQPGCSLRLSLFTDPAKPHSDFPRLKTKAAETKHLAKPLLAAWNEYAPEDAVEHTQARMLLEASIEIDELLDSTKNLWKLAAAQARRLRMLGNRRKAAPSFPDSVM